MIINLCLEPIAILGFLTSTVFLWRAKQVHFFVGLSWGIGLATAIAGFFETLNWQNPGFAAEWKGIFTVFLVICGQSLLFWLVAFEFFASALTMEDILLKRPESLSRRKKYLIFTSAAGFQILVFVVLCLKQYDTN